MMPDHFHLLIYIPELHDSAPLIDTGKSRSDILRRKIGTILSSYTQAINKQELRTGSLFQPKTKAKKIDNDNHLLCAFHYIHQNPLRAGLVKHIQDWKYSSFSEFYREKIILVDDDIVKIFLDLDLNPAKLLKESNLMVPDNLISSFIE
jgi:putative transposase